ncbi:MAG: glycosyltransferase, partial [Armatimonadetes bacterium]|nr:glycosyltransferase [Armatimonadota bacterium]
MVGAVEVPTRVVRVISRMCISGVPQHVVVLAAGLVPPRYETIVLTGSVPGAEGDMTYYATAHGVEPRYIPAMSREVSVLDDLRALWAMYREIRRLRPTIVHTHTAKAGFLGRVAAWMAGVPVIVHTYHGHVLRGYFGPLKTALYRTLERLCAHLSTCLLTVSEAVREDLLSLGVGRPSQMRVVPLGLELRRFAEVPPGGGCLRRELGLRPEVPLIGYCGRLVPIKNLSLYLRAVARLAARRPDLHAVVIGDGELRAALEAEAAALDLGQVVHFLGWRQDTPALYRDLDLMVLTSRNEGTPVAVIEAAAAGV